MITGKTKEISLLVQTALDAGADPQDIIDNYLIDAMKEVGARFEADKIFVPEMMIAARTSLANSLRKALGPSTCIKSLNRGFEDMTISDNGPVSAGFPL